MKLKQDTRAFKLTKSARVYANLGEIMSMANATMVASYADDAIVDAWSVWVTQADTVFSWDGKHITVGKGFMTDFASIPKVMRWLFDPNGAPHQVAAVIHDYAYSTMPVTRVQADRLFRSACDAVGAPYVSSRVMFYALRVGGWFAWRKNRAGLLEFGPRWRMLEG